MYLSEPTLTGLESFFCGFEVALVLHNVEFEHVGLWRGGSGKLPTFHHWAARKLGTGTGNAAYSHTILKHTNDDEVAALALFWELLDEYRALEAEVDGGGAD